MKNAKSMLRKLDYLPRWSWYVLSLFVGGPVGPFIVYLVFHMLTRMAQEQTAQEQNTDSFDWDVDIDNHGVHVRGRGDQHRKGNTYADTDCTVSDDSEIEREWAQTAASANSAQQQEETPHDPSIDPDADVQDVIREGRAAMRRIRHANDLIPDPALSAQIDSIENSCSQILSILEQRPQLLSQLRTFLRYYLPTTLKLLDARAKLENTANTPKAREVRARISEAVGVIDKAFLKQVEALDAYRFIDLESEMDVLSDMLKADGLIDDEAPAEDPFAQVLQDRKNQSGDSHGGTPMATH